MAINEDMKATVNGIPFLSCTLKLDPVSLPPGARVFPIKPAPPVIIKMELTEQGRKDIQAVIYDALKGGNINDNLN